MPPQEFWAWSTSSTRWSFRFVGSAKNPLTPTMGRPSMGAMRRASSSSAVGFASTSSTLGLSLGMSMTWYVGVDGPTGFQTELAGKKGRGTRAARGR